MSESIDVVVIGLGPGGEHVAAQLAQAGLSVLGVDKHLVGGECPYYGCIPSKMMIRAANALAEAGRVPTLGGSVEVTPDWTTVAKRISDEATDAWNDTGRRRPADPQRRPVRAGPRPAGRAGQGRRRNLRRQRGVRRTTWRRAQPRHAPGRTAGRRAGGHAVLDQPRRRAGHRAPGQHGRARRRRRSAASSLRPSPGSGCRSPSSRPRERILGPEEPEASAVVAEAIGRRGHRRPRRSRRSTGSSTTLRRVHRHSRGRRAAHRRPRSWWRPVAVPT